MNEYCYKCGGVHPPMGIAGCPGQSLVEAFSDPRDATIAALREENARKDEALKEARRFVSWMIRRAELSDEADQEKEGCKCLKVIDAALASARPAPAQEQGEEELRATKRREFSLDLLCYEMETQGHKDWADEVRALLARKPAELGSEGNPYKGTYNSVVFERHDSGLRVGICERDDGFEFVAHGTAGESSHYRLHPSAVFERLDRPSKPAEEVKPPSGMMSGGIQPCAEVEARAKGETK